MPLRNGEFIGAYQIIAPLGHGGMATVYKAYHDRLNRYVAIKMIHPNYLQDPNFLARFEREAQIVAALEHPNIVPVYDFSEHEGEPYLVMKLVEGSTLKAVLTQGELPAGDILTIMEPIARALDYAHSKGVLHRDIKPSNIILDQQAAPYLTDFGLARLSVSGASTLSADMMIGTPYYMSPEQARGKGEVDHRSDLYSLGVVFYELFVGNVPFHEGTPYAIINDHIARELPLPSSQNPDIPITIEAVLLRALMKDPDDRYQSAVELVAAVRDAITDSFTDNQQKLTLLNEGRKSAILSVAQEMQSSSTREGIQTAGRSRAPVSDMKTPSAAVPTQPSTKPAPSQRGSRWMLESAAIVVGILVIVILIAFALSRNNQQDIILPTQAVLAQAASATPTRLAPTNTAMPAVTTLSTQVEMVAPPPTRAAALPPTRETGQGPQLGADGNPLPPPTVMPIPLPDMGLEQAQAAINRDSNFIGNYLALYRAQLQSSEIAGARRTLADGAEHAPIPVAYWMTAAGIAVQSNNYEIAFLCYSTALEVAQGQREFPAVRWTAGEYLYRAATLTDHLSLLQIRALSQELAQNDSPIVSAMIARAFLANGNVRLAEISITKALNLADNIGEVHLVNGELLHEQGDNTLARLELQHARDVQDSPTWVRERASELLSELEDSNND